MINNYQIGNWQTFGADRPGSVNSMADRELLSIVYCLLPIVYCTLVYSVLKLFTGFATAALNACKLMVITAINTASTPAMAKIHQLIFVL
jgi:hypothetical protein